MTDLPVLAQQAISVLGPAISLAASATVTHFSDGFLSEPGAKLFNWLASRLRETPAAATLNRAVAEPNNPRRLEALRLEIEDLAESDTSFREQLIDLIKETSAGVGNVTSTQTLTQDGVNNKSAQATGKDINIHFT